MIIKKYFSMFSGIGGFELGIENAYRKKDRGIQENQKDYDEERNRLESEKGKRINNKGGWNGKQSYSNTNSRATCVGFSEIDKYAISTYKKHFPTHKNYGNAKDINPKKLQNFDLLIGGFPCQSFSIAGKRKGFQDTRGTLFHEILRIMAAKKPRLFLLENVKGLLSADDGRCFATIITSLEKLGYFIEWQVLNSKHFGVPQNRERVFIIGHLRGTSIKHIFPFKTSKSKDIITNRIKGKVKIRKYPVDIDRLKSCLKKHKNMSIKEISEKLDIKKTTIEHWFRNDNSFAIPDKEIWFKLRKLLNINTENFDKSITQFEIRDNEFDQSNRVYHKDGISPTITTLTGGHQHTAIDDGYTIRRLTPIECERLQGFPDNWTIGSDTQRYKQCGNAVTVNVIEAIINKIITSTT